MAYNKIMFHYTHLFNYDEPKPQAELSGAGGLGETHSWYCPP